MVVTVGSQSPAEIACDLLAVPVAELGKEIDEGRDRLPPRLAALDRALGGRISAVVQCGDFRGRRDQTLLLYPEGGLPARRVLLLGTGPEERLDAEALRRAAGAAVGQAAAKRCAKLALAVPPSRRVRGAQAAGALAEGAVLASYRFDSYRRGDGEEDPPGEVASVELCFERAGDLRALRAAAREGALLAECQNLARQLSNEPANLLPPAELANRAQHVAREVGLRCRVLGVPELEKLGMGAMLAVGRGSANPPRLVVLEHRPPRAKSGRTRKGDAICFVGKGITFDSGGISIKPSAGMEEMKHDMSGAAAVVGALRACALLKVPHHVVGILAAAENLPSGTSYRPGDILTSMSGKTIEVMNTDAEGRVVLADAIHYARTEFAPRAILDLATLTGACVVALGRWATGLFGNNDKLIELVRGAGDATGERVWPLPLFDGHHKAVRSKVATVKNTGAGREAGSSTAAAFLAAFVEETPWVHLDIAGTGWTSHPGPYQPRGATGVGVRLLLEVLKGWRDARIA